MIEMKHIYLMSPILFLVSGNNFPGAVNGRETWLSNIASGPAMQSSGLQTIIGTLRLWLLLLPLPLLSCNKNGETVEVVTPLPSDADTTVFEAPYSRYSLETNQTYTLFAQPHLTYKLPEASGIVTGRTNKGLVYIHEDSGNRHVVFVYDTLGTHLGDIVLVGAKNRDWEDLAIGPGPEKGKNYIYVGDIGDNSSVRSHLTIYRFIEPVIDLDTIAIPFKLEIADFNTITYQYPDGPRDAETLMIDPKNSDLIVISKRDVKVRVYLIPYPQNTHDLAVTYFKGVLPFREIVAGDISPDGRKMMIKDYGRIYHWHVDKRVTALSSLFSVTPTVVEYIPEVQGEALGWTQCGQGYFTTTETKNHAADPILYHYKTASP
jgi:hypothetical protein